MTHDLTLEQKIEVAAEQIENSLELGLSSEKRQIRLILTQFAQELVSGDSTGDSGLHLQRVSNLLPDPYKGEHNKDRIAEYQRLAAEYRCDEWTVGRIFSKGIDFMRQLARQ